MFLQLIIGLTALFISPGSSAKPVKFRTMNINFYADSALVINEGQSQIFRVPLCKGQFLDKWSFRAKVYLMNVPWDAEKIGDDNWLHMQVSNGPDMRNVVRDNVREAHAAGPGADPQPFTEPFTYNKETWGTDDIYVMITASQGTPTYQYGLEITTSQPQYGFNIPDGMDAVDTVSQDHISTGDSAIETLEQIAIPLTDSLISGETGQYKVLFCFEDIHQQRKLTMITRVSAALDKAPGGVASFVCTSAMIRGGICWRSMVIARGIRFYDPSGAKVVSSTPIIPRAEYGPIHVLVLIQGHYRERVKFTLTVKLRKPPLDKITLTGNTKEDLDSVVTNLKSTWYV